jgi:hypothetical protein
LRDLKAERLAIAQEDMHNTRDAIQRDFSDPRRIGKHYERMFKHSQSAVVDSAVDELGRTTWDPKCYKNIVKEQIGAIFANEVEEPKDNDGKRFPTSQRGSTDVREWNCKPFWWKKIYSREAKGIDETTFEQIMDNVTPEQVYKQIRNTCGEKSAGIDGVSIDLLKLLVRNDLLKRPKSQGSSTSTLLLLTEIINASFACGQVCEILKFGRITLVPKTNSDGSFSRDPSEMRPITVLPELGRIANRILADRLGTILLEHPHLLSPAQRAFLRNGDTSQCVNPVIDVIEDWTINKKPLGSPIFMVSYDQRKAFDCVQKFTIEATLKRFNMPAKFIEYVLSSLHGAQSCVKTKHGLTETFNIKTSVRQGDPLAPLLFILISDALHCGLQSNPLYEGVSDSYEMSNSPGCSVASSGFADDNLIVCDTLEGIQRQHEWIRAFFGAHIWDFNTKKTKFVIGNPGPTHVPALPDVNGKQSILPLPSSCTFRYLGIHLNLDLDWTTQLEIMDKAVSKVANSIMINKLDINMSADAVNCYLIPKLNVALQVLPIPLNISRRWDSTLVTSALSAAKFRLRQNLCREAVHSVTGMLRITDTAPIVRCSELVIRLNSMQPYVYKTAWARLANGVQLRLPHPHAQADLHEVLTRVAQLPAATESNVAMTLNRALECANQLELLFDCRLATTEKPSPNPAWPKQGTLVPC